MAHTANVLNSLVPITQFNRGQAARIFDRLHSENQLVVLKNNQPAAVILSPAEFQRLSEIEEDYLLLREAMARLSANTAPATPMGDVMRELDITQEELDAAEDVIMEDSMEPESSVSRAERKASRMEKPIPAFSHHSPVSKESRYSASRATASGPESRTREESTGRISPEASTGRSSTGHHPWILYNVSIGFPNLHFSLSSEGENSMICVIAKLAPDATERLNNLRKAVVSKELPVKPFYGHITIATYLPDDDDFVQVCSEIIRETPSFRIRYEKLEVLSETSIIVAVPSKPDVLLALHNRIAEKYGRSLDRWTCGTDWYPHTTLLYDPDADLNVLCRNMQEHFIPFETYIRQIEFSRVAETGYTILESIDLKQH